MPKINLHSLSAAELAELLRKAGSSSVSMERISRLLESGAPSNPDGTIDLVHFSAWMVKEYQIRND